MTVLVAYVSTNEGRAALQWAAQEAANRDTDLVVVDSTRTDDGGHSDIADQLTQLPAGIRARVAEQPGGTDGDPAESVLAVAEDTNAELLVIGLRRRTSVGKLILGSSAQRLLLDAGCPVVAIKPEDSARD